MEKLSLFINTNIFLTINQYTVHYKNHSGPIPNRQSRLDHGLHNTFVFNSPPQPALL